MNIYAKSGIALALIVASFFAWKHFDEPITYEECIFKNMKGVENERSAIAIQAACKLKFNPYAGKFDDIFEKATKP